MSKIPKIKSTYAIVDVMKGRRALKRYLEANGALRVTIVAELTDPYGGDDGVSIEFNANVISIAPQGIEAFGGDANAAPSRSDESPSGKAGAPNNPLISTPTHKGEEG